MYFKYKTKNHTSEKYDSGMLAADNIDSAADILKKRGETILELSGIKDYFGLIQIWHAILYKVTKKLEIEFFTMLSFMLDAGMSLYESLLVIGTAATSRKFRQLVMNIADEVRKGATLSQALKKSSGFERSLVEQIGAAEESGSIPETLRRLIVQIEHETEFSAKIKSAMIYPCVISVVMTAVLWIMMTMVVPTISSTLIDMGGELPPITKIVIMISNFMAKTTVYWLLLIIGLFIVYKHFIKNADFKYRVDSLKLKMPIVGNTLTKLEMSRFCRALAAMHRSGISLVSSLEITASSLKNRQLLLAVKKAAKLIEVSGVSLSTALAKTANFPEMMIRLIEVGVNSGQICNVLDKIAYQYERDADSSIKRITALIEPAMIIIVGFLAALVVVSVFLPLLSLSDNL